MGAVTHGYRCPGGFPGLVSRVAGTLLQRIIAFHVFIRRSHGPATDGHAAIYRNIGIMTNDDCIGSICHRIFIICRTQDDIIIFVRQFMVITQHQVGLVFVYAGTGNGVVRANDVVVPAVFYGVVEAVHIVQLGGCAFCVLFATAGDSIPHAYHLCHIGARHGVAAAHDHDLAAAGGNRCLQGFIQFLRIFQVLHDGAGLLEIDGPIGIGDAVSCAVDQGGIGVGGHIGLADDAVRYAAEGLGSAGIVVDIECAIGEGCGAAEVIAPRSSRFIHDAGEGTGHGGSNAAGIGHVPRCEACKFFGPLIVIIQILGIFLKDVSCLVFVVVIDAVVLGLCLFQLGHVHCVRIFRARCHVGNLAGHLPGCIAYGNGSCRGLPDACGIAAVVLPFQVEANGPFIGGGNGAAAQSHAVIYGGIGVISQDGDILVLCGQSFFSRANNDGIICSIHIPVIAQQLGFGCILQTVLGAQDGNISGIIDDVAVTDNSCRTAAILVFNGCTHGFRQGIGIRNAIFRLDARSIEIIDGVGHHVAGAYHHCAIGILCPVRRAQDAVCHACRIVVFTGQAFHAVQGAYHGCAKVLDPVGLFTPFCIVIVAGNSRITAHNSGKYAIVIAVVTNGCGIDAF